MRNLKSLFLVMLAVTLSFSSCKENDPETDAYVILSDYLEDNGMDLPAILGDKSAGTFFAMAAPENGDLSSKYIMDLRGETDFNAGHIEGANRVDFENILAEAAKAEGKPIIVVCKTGQTACYATSLLRMYGYPSTKALKWGMSGWHTDLDKWSVNCKDLTSNQNWTMDAKAAGSFETPMLSTSLTEGAALLQARVEAVVAAGFKAVPPQTVLDNYADYYINNFFPQADYDGFGHVMGATMVKPLNLDVMNKLDPNGKVVTYCYTGQTSAMITAYLNVLGYDAYSLLFGVNGMTTSNTYWETGGIKNHWGFDSKSKELSYQTN